MFSHFFVLCLNSLLLGQYCHVYCEADISDDDEEDGSQAASDDDSEASFGLNKLKGGGNRNDDEEMVPLITPVRNVNVFI